jgi:hypothetical protein
MNSILKSLVIGTCLTFIAGVSFAQQATKMQPLTPKSTTPQDAENGNMGNNANEDIMNINKGDNNNSNSKDASAGNIDDTEKTQPSPADTNTTNKNNCSSD